MDGQVGAPGLEDVDDDMQHDQPQHDQLEQLNPDQLAALQQQQLEDEALERQRLEDEEADRLRMAETAHDRAMRRLRDCVKFAPEFRGNVPFRVFLQKLRNWASLAWTAPPATDISEDVKKRTLVMLIKEPAYQRLTAVVDGSTEWENATTFEDYLAVVQGIFAPPAESSLARTEFNQRKQGRDEDMLMFYSTKVALFESAFKEGERHFPTLSDSILEGVYSKLVTRQVRRKNPQTQQQLLIDLLDVVASERDCVFLKCGESSNLDGLAISSTNYSGGSYHGGTPMEIGKIDKSKSNCRKCGKLGHWAKECRSGSSNQKSGGQKKGKKQPSYKPKKSGGGKKCYTCGQVGHFSKTCYKNKGKPGVKKVEAEEKTPGTPSQGGSNGADQGHGDPFALTYAPQ